MEKKKTTTKKAMSKLGSYGGKATLKKHGRKYFSMIGKLSALAKKNNGKQKKIQSQGK